MFMGYNRKYITKNTDNIEITVDQTYMRFEKRIKDMDAFKQKMQFMEQMHYFKHIIQVINDPPKYHRYYIDVHRQRSINESREIVNSGLQTPLEFIRKFDNA